MAVNQQYQYGIPGFSLSTVGVGSNSPVTSTNPLPSAGTGAAGGLIGGITSPITSQTATGAATGAVVKPAPSSPSPATTNFMDFYKGWDPTAAQADFTKMYGGDINRLSSAKGGSSSSGVTVSKSLGSPNLNSLDQSTIQSLIDSANAGNEADRAYINSLYDQQQGQMQGQLSTAQGDYNNALSQVDLNTNNSLADVEKQKRTAKDTGDTQVNQAADTARSTQAVNRNVLRALGILNSSYAADKLQEPMNEFDKARAGIVSNVTQRLSDLDTYMNQVKGQANQTKNQLLSQYNTLKGNIENDIRFSQQERNAALLQARAALSDRVNQLNAQYQSAQQQINQAKQSYATQLTALSKALPSPTGAIANTSIANKNPTVTPQQVSIASPQNVPLSDQRRYLLSSPYGLDLNAAISSGGLTF